MERTRPGRSARSGAIPPFQVFLEEHRVPVYRFLAAAVGPAEADDSFQETFLSALRAYPNLRDGRNLRGWILAIAGRKVIDAARARGRHPVPVAEVPEVPNSGREGDPELFDDPVWRAVRKLPPRQRVAVVHRVVMDRSYEETAAAMRCSVETARAHVYQGLRRLRSEVTAT
jgi:RNA polymerase sigma factor (sigma-70 family)